MKIAPPARPPLRFRREPLITPEESARVHALALRILAEIGIEVHAPQHLARLASCPGLRAGSGNRVTFDPAAVDEFVDDLRRRNLAWAEAQPPRADDGTISLSVSPYSLYVHDPASGGVERYTTASLIQMTKLIDSLAGEHVYGVPPGIPMDVPPDLQAVAQYRIASLYARQQATPVGPTSPKTAHYVLDMAEVMGRPIRHLPVYIPTPLRLGGESLEVVLACADRLDGIRVDSMPSTGLSAPLHPFGALALAAAEVIGGALVVQLLSGKPASFWAAIFPADLREGAMVFGSPENMLFHMLLQDFNRFYGYSVSGAPDNIHVMAKLPDAQSAAEKASIMALGASLGCRHFWCAGTLSLDEIFSPEQLLLDCEIRDWAQRAIQGVWLGEEAVDDWLENIRDGIQHGFLGQDATLDYYKAHTWYPRWFRRDAVGAWLHKGQPRLSDALREEALRRIAAHEYELDPVRCRDIERIYAAAEAAVG